MYIQQNCDMKTATLSLLLLSMLAFSSAFEIDEFLHDTSSSDGVNSRGRRQRREANNIPLTTAPPSVPISCMNEAGDSVPWYIVYKIPKDEGTSTQHDLAKKGKAYVFLHASNKNWNLGSKGIDDKNSMLGKTLKQTKLENSIWISYNDQYPHSNDSDGAHSNGIIIANAASESAVWIVHSVAKLPIPSSSKFYPPSELEKGQIIMCMTMNFTELTEVVKHLNEIGVFLHRRNLISLDTLKNALNNNETNLNLYMSLGTNLAAYEENTKVEKMDFKIGTNPEEFKVLFKPPASHKDMYSGILKKNVFPTIMKVRANWCNGAVYGTTATVSCVTKLYFTGKDSNEENKTFSFDQSMDNSTWALGQAIGSPSFCITDLILKEKGLQQGGGLAVCIKDEQVWTAFNGIITNE